MSAINNTILSNLKHPALVNQKLQLTPAQLSPEYLCVVLNASQARDLENYIVGFEGRLTEVWGQVNTGGLQEQYGRACE